MNERSTEDEPTPSAQETPYHYPEMVSMYVDKINALLTESGPETKGSVKLILEELAGTAYEMGKDDGITFHNPLEIVDREE